MKSILLNGVLVLLSSLVTFFILEWVITDIYIHKTPIKFHFALPKAMQVLAQSSKKSSVPKDYILLVGDSYAQGKGDWLLNADSDKNSAYHSAHLITQYTGRDVISFGLSGASSIVGLVVEPIARFDFIKRNIETELQVPKEILVYFYEGNDLSDNWLELSGRFVKQYGWDQVNNDVVWDEYLSQEIKNNRMGAIKHMDTNFGWLPRAIIKVFKNSLKPAEDREIDVHAENFDKVFNQALIKGRLIPLADQLQAPAMDLNEEQTKLALDIFARSLKYLKSYFKTAHITLVYIPSVIASYDTASKNQLGLSVQAPNNKSQLFFSKILLEQRSNKISHEIENIARQQSISFVDTRPNIIQAGKQQYIHGPRDWKHFNQVGYEALTQAILCSDVLKEDVSIEKCP